MHVNVGLHPAGCVARVSISLATTLLQEKKIEMMIIMQKRPEIGIQPLLGFYICGLNRTLRLRLEAGRLFSRGSCFQTKTPYLFASSTQVPLLPSDSAVRLRQQKDNAIVCCTSNKSSAIRLLCEGSINKTFFQCKNACLESTFLTLRQVFYISRSIRSTKMINKSHGIKVIRLRVGSY